MADLEVAAEHGHPGSDGRTGVAALRDLALRHPLVAVLVVALVVRIAAIAAVALFFGDIFYDADDDTYFGMAVNRATGSTSSWDPFHFQLFDRTAAFMWPLTGLLYLVGPSPVAGSLLVAVLGALTALAVTYLGIQIVNVRTGLVAGTFIAFLPSQIAWSSLILKDAMAWLCGCLAVVGLVRMTRPSSEWARGAMISASGLVGLAFTRLHSAIVIAWAVTAGGLWLVRRYGVRPFGTALLLAVAVPWIAGVGLFGEQFFSAAPVPSEQRQTFAEGAESAIDVPEPGDTTGDNVPEAESETEPEEFGGDSLINELAHLPRGYSVMFLEPYPWHPRNDARFLLAKIDTLLWYPALFLALFGAYYSLRRSTPAVLVVAVVAGLSTALALYEGNLGTAFRHRGELVWGVAVLAAIGWREIRDRKATST